MLDGLQLRVCQVSHGVKEEPLSSLLADFYDELMEQSGEDAADVEHMYMT